MVLEAYLKKNGISQEDFAKLLGVSQGLISQWIIGKTRITAERAIEIEEKTGGKVSREELRPELFRRNGEAERA